MLEEIRAYQAALGAKLHYREWCVASPRGRVVILHGIESHSGWYLASGSFLAKKGFAVYALDRRGSGLNLEDRGDTPSFKTLLEDIRLFIEGLPDLPHPTGQVQPRPEEQAPPPAPLHLIGISWGGKLATALTLLHPEHITSLMLITPGLASKVDFSTREKLDIFFSSLFAARRKFKIPIEEPEMFTANPQKIEYIKADGLRLKEATARFFAESVKLDLFLRKRIHLLRKPLFLMLAGIDPIIDNQRIISLVEQIPADEKKIKVYAHYHHTLEFEENPQEFLEDLAAWVEAHSARRD